MMLFNCMCFQEMTIPGNVLPKMFSHPWDKAPPATPTTPSVKMLWICCTTYCTTNPQQPR